MRVWTVQPVAVWNQVQRYGEARVDITCINEYASVPDSYHWLAKQLKVRLPGYRADLPWWAYCKKPDLRYRVWRTCHGHERQVRIELELPPDRVFAMPCWAWDLVYSGFYLCYNRQEHDEWLERVRQAGFDEEEYRYCEGALRQELHASWERLFAAELPAEDWNVDTWLKLGARREAVFDLIRREDVRAATLFTTRQRG